VSARVVVVAAVVVVVADAAVAAAVAGRRLVALRLRRLFRAERGVAFFFAAQFGAWLR
jgi:hypothetical protein